SPSTAQRPLTRSLRWAGNAFFGLSRLSRLERAPTEARLRFRSSHGCRQRPEGAKGGTPSALGSALSPTHEPRIADHRSHVRDLAARNQGASPQAARGQIWKTPGPRTCEDSHGTPACDLPSTATQDPL